MIHEALMPFSVNTGAIEVMVEAEGKDEEIEIIRKPKHLTINETYDEDICMTGKQTVVDDDGNCLYCVWNLTDCPEDAIIGRDLFSAEEWVKAVEYGMQLTKDGYDSIEVTVNESEEG